MPKLAVCLVSGGMDSVATLVRVLEEGYYVVSLTFDYGQKHGVEVEVFKQRTLLAIKHFRDYRERYIKHVVVNLRCDDMPLYAYLRKSVLGEVSEDAVRESMRKATDELEYYYPFRNLLFTTLAGIVAEYFSVVFCDSDTKFKDLSCDEALIVLGLHKHVTYANYWDTVPEFVDAVNALLKVRDKYNKIPKKVSLYAPFLHATKADIVKYLVSKSFPLDDVWTCYSPVYRNGQYHSCKQCQSCVERAELVEKAVKECGILVNNVVLERFKYPSFEFESQHILQTGEVSKDEERKDSQT